MAQYDVYENPNPLTQEDFPSLLDVQVNMHHSFPVRVVVPLVPATFVKKTHQDMCPILLVNDDEFVMSTFDIAGISKKSIGPFVCSLADNASTISHVVDKLFRIT
jgi:toxin CcdB